MAEPSPPPKRPNPLAWRTQSFLKSSVRKFLGIENQETVQHDEDQYWKEREAEQAAAARDLRLSSTSEVERSLSFRSFDSLSRRGSAASLPHVLRRGSVRGVQRGSRGPRGPSSLSRAVMRSTDSDAELGQTADERESAVPTSQSPSVGVPEPPDSPYTFRRHGENSADRSSDLDEDAAELTRSGDARPPTIAPKRSAAALDRATAAAAGRPTPPARPPAGAADGSSSSSSSSTDSDSSDSSSDSGSESSGHLVGVAAGSAAALSHDQVHVSVGGGRQPSPLSNGVAHPRGAAISAAGEKQSASIPAAASPSDVGRPSSSEASGRAASDASVEGPARPAIRSARRRSVEASSTPAKEKGQLRVSFGDEEEPAGRSDSVRDLRAAAVAPGLDGDDLSDGTERLYIDSENGSGEEYSISGFRLKEDDDRKLYMSRDVGMSGSDGFWDLQELQLGGNLLDMFGTLGRDRAQRNWEDKGTMRGSGRGRGLGRGRDRGGARGGRGRPRTVVKGQTATRPEPAAAKGMHILRRPHRHRQYFTVAVSLVDVAIMIWAIVVNDGFEEFDQNVFGGPSQLTLIRCGAKYVPGIIKGEAWRFISAIFLHSGLIHLIICLALQFRLLWLLERHFGSWRIGVIYVLCGAFGNVVSSVFVPLGVGCGSDGALFGFLGVYVTELIQTWHALKHPGRDALFLGVVIVLSLAFGLLPMIDNWAHIGGFVMGIVTGFVFLPNLNGAIYKKVRQKKQKQPPAKKQPPANNKRKMTQEASSYETVEVLVVPEGPDGSVRKNAERIERTANRRLVIVCTLIPLGIILFVVMLFVVYLGVNAFDWCPGCQYFDCLPVLDWCDPSTAINLGQLPTV